MEELHSQCLCDAAAVLLADPGVSALAGANVSDTAPAGPVEPASHFGSCHVVLSKGKAHPYRRGSPAKLAQLDVRVECVADSERLRNMLLDAVVFALNGWKGTAGVLRNAVHNDSGKFEEAGTSFSRRDRFACFVQVPDGIAASDPPAPAPAPAPPRAAPKTPPAPEE